VLFTSSGFGFLETCDAIVVELTDEAASRLVRVQPSAGTPVTIPPSGWSNTPMPESTEQHPYYRGAFGCGASRRPLGDLEGALSRPGAFYKLVNGGEGIGIIVPRAKIAGFFYFG
jgi:hypothetical protein